MKIVILAGGSGTRLWPLSRAEHPKQFLHFGEKYSLLQKTVLRFLKRYTSQQLLIITNQGVVDLVRSQLISIDPDLEESICLEPCQKGTAVAIAWALKCLEEKGRLQATEPLLISPSDHLIYPEEVFLEKIEEASEAAVQGKIIAFGVRPTRPETGYGYIKTSGSTDLEAIEEFIEKPDCETATKFVLSQKYFWNMGIFLLTKETFWQEAALYEPQIGRCKTALMGELSAQFHNFSSSSFDYAIMEKTNKGVVMPLELTWSDVGSWDSLYEAMEKDEQSNVTMGNVHSIDTKNCLIIGGKRLISTIGLEEMLIVDTEDAIFIAKRGDSQKVRALVEILKARTL